MAKKFDATLNSLIDEWAAFLGARVGVHLGPVTPLDDRVLEATTWDEMIAGL